MLPGSLAFKAKVASWTAVFLPHRMVQNRHVLSIKHWQLVILCFVAIYVEEGLRVLEVESYPTPIGKALVVHLGSNERTEFRP